LSKGLDIAILGELAPGAFHYGMTCLVEFEPHSLWHEISLTIASEALKQGIKTEYHVFEHTPQDIRTALKDMNLDVEEFEARNTFRIMDSYTPTTPLKPTTEGKSEPMLSGRNPDLPQWIRAIRERMESGFPEEEKRWLHIDDNEGILLQFNDEDYVTKGWRTTFVPMAKSRDLLTLHAFVSGVASETFFKKREAAADAIIDIKTEEKRGKLEHFIRLRALRGARFDSSWRRIELHETNRVRLLSGRDAFVFENDEAQRVFDYLLKEFVDDYYGTKLPMDSSGWRSLVEIARNMGARTTLFYSTKYSMLFRDLIKRNMIERKFFSKERGRGGSVARLRIAYQNDSVREMLERYSKK
jgi:KaiC/GvpD/RAD55 family RecA-like ATPase